MQEGWGGRSTEEPTSAGGPWEAKDMDVWSGTAAKQESSSWGNLPRKVPLKVTEVGGLLPKSLSCYWFAG